MINSAALNARLHTGTTAIFDSSIKAFTLKAFVELVTIHKPLIAAELFGPEHPSPWAAGSKWQAMIQVATQPTQQPQQTNCCQ